MSWFKVDDKFHSSPKVLAARAGKRYKNAIALWVLTGSWCGDQLTNGAIPLAAVEMLGFAKADAEELVRIGLWDRDGEHYQFHDWDDYQPSREQVLAKREDARGRVARHRAKKKDSESSEPVTSKKRPGNATPSRPVPARTKRNPRDTSARETEAFGLGFDLQIVAKIFSNERDKAKLGKYRLSMRAHDDAAGVVQWAIEEADSQTDKTITPQACVQSSAYAYFAYGDDWHRENRFPFGAWAKDPGAWLARGIAEAKKSKRRSNG